MSNLKVAIQKSGRLSEKSLQLFKECGISLSNSSRKLKATASNFPIEFLFLRDDDIPQYVEQGVADIGIIGQNELWEQEKSVDIVRNLGFAKCRMSLALPRETNYNGLEDFTGKRIATTYPRILKRFFEEKTIEVSVEELSGSVEIAPSIGLSNAIFDIVSTGSTLMMNGLKEVEVVTTSEAVLIANTQLSNKKSAVLDRLLFRIDAVNRGLNHRYILLNAPNESLEAITALLPGMKSPTLLPLARSGWSSLHSVVEEKAFWKVIDQLKALGAQGILVMPIEKMVA